MELRVILVEPKEEGNIGSVARIMKNFGFKELYLVNPCKFGSVTKAFACHGYDVIENAKILKSFDEAIDGCNLIVATTGKKGGQRILERITLDPESFAERANQYNGKIGIVFGRESMGLLNEELKKCNFTVRIGTNKEYPILNLAQSACVVLYELSKNRFKKHVNERPPEKEEWDSLMEYLDIVVDKLYDREHKRKIAKGVFKRILSKAFLNAREANTVTGFFRKVNSKVKK